LQELWKDTITYTIMIKRIWTTLFIITALVILTEGAFSQTRIWLREKVTRSSEIEIHVGETKTIEVWFKTGTIRTSGVSFYITFNDNYFEVIDNNPSKEGIQPFNFSGNVYGSSQGIVNLSELDIMGATGIAGFQLSGSVVESGISISGNELYLGSFRLRATNIIPSTEVTIEWNRGTHRDTRYHLPNNGTGYFDIRTPLTVKVVGIGVEGIPDVVMKPGETNDKLILDDYVVNTSLPPSLLGWSHSGGGGNVFVNINPETHRVTFSSRSGFTGMEKIVFRVTDGSYSGKDSMNVIVSYAPKISGVPSSITFYEDLYYENFYIDQMATDQDNPTSSLTWSSTVDAGSLNVDIYYPNRQIFINAAPDWNGEGRFTLFVSDPYGLKDSISVTATVIPVNDAPRVSGLPDIFLLPSETNNDIQLLDYMEDVDHPEDAVAFTFTGNINVNIELNPNDRYRVSFSAKPGFLGTEEIIFNAIDPQNDVGRDTMLVTVRRKPPRITPRLPDTTIVSLNVNSTVSYVDLDNYIIDEDNSIEQITWESEVTRVSKSGNPSMSFQIDSDHLAKFIVPAVTHERDRIIFTAQDPDGGIDKDTVFVNIINDNRPLILGLPEKIFVPVGGENKDYNLRNFVLDINDSYENLIWSFLGYNKVSLNVENSGLLVVSSPDPAFAGSERVTFTVSDPSGKYDAATVEIIVIPADGSPLISGLPDISITAKKDGNLILNDYLFIYPDSLITHVVWSVVPAEDPKVSVTITPQSTETFFKVKDINYRGMRQFIFTATNTKNGKTVSDSMNVTVTLGKAPILGRLPDISFPTGKGDSTLHLNRYVIDRDSSPDSMVWSVTGNFNVLVDQNSLKKGGDHILKLGNVHDFVGEETLEITVTDPEGNSASDAIKVSVVSSTVIEIRVLQNPVSEEYLDLVVLSTDTLFGVPELSLTHNKKVYKVSASRIANSLVWKGDYVFERDDAGKIQIVARSVDRFKTVVMDSIEFTLGVVSPLKKTVISDNYLSMEIEENTFREEKHVYLIPEKDREILIDELYTQYGIDELSDPLMLYQVQMGNDPLRKDALISFNNDNLKQASRKTSLFYLDNNSRKITYLDNIDSSNDVFMSRINRSGRLLLARDVKPPFVRGIEITGNNLISLQVYYSENGSGLDYNKSEVIIDGKQIHFSVIEWTDNYIMANVMKEIADGTHELKLRLKDRSGNFSDVYEEDFNYDAKQIPGGYELFQNYPNPFNPETVIRYSIPENGRIFIGIYSILGQRIRTLVDDEKPAGTHKIIWDGKNDQGTGVSSGVYICVMRAESFKKTRKMIYAK